MKSIIEASVLTYPKWYKYPSSWGPVIAVLLIIAGMSLLILGSWRLSDGLNGIVIDYSNPYVHFSETTAEQEITNGIIYLFFGALCFVVFMILLLLDEKSCFHQNTSHGKKIITRHNLFRKLNSTPSAVDCAEAKPVEGKRNTASLRNLRRTHRRLQVRLSLLRRNRPLHMLHRHRQSNRRINQHSFASIISCCEKTRW
jgi:hypothetical protein